MQILRDIRGLIAGTNERLDATNVRLDGVREELAGRIDSVAYELRSRIEKHLKL